MLLSEAIRIGAAKYPKQAIHTFIKQDTPLGEPALCVLGAAAIGAGMKLEFFSNVDEDGVPYADEANKLYYFDYHEIWRRLPQLKDDLTLPEGVEFDPAWEWKYTNAWNVIAYLNDNGWTREAIADWLETKGL